MKLRNKKTGEIVDLSVGYIRDAHNGEFIQIKPVACLEDKGSYLYDTFANLSEDWEDYKPAEPYIKDEKIRKAVRAWAEANGIKEIIIFDHCNNAPYTPVGVVEFAGNAGHLRICFKTDEKIDTDRIYSVPELCGEEENE